MALVKKAPEPVITAEEAAQAKALENELFGGADALLQRVAGNAVETATDGSDSDASLPLEGTDADQATAVEVPENISKSQKRTRTPVWTDPDTQDIEVDIRSAPRLRKLRKDESDSTLKGMFQNCLNPLQIAAHLVLPITHTVPLSPSMPRLQAQSTRSACARSMASSTSAPPGRTVAARSHRPRKKR